MKELSDILAHAARLRSEGRPFALATVVKVDGSTYRRPGARLLVVPDGLSGEASAPETVGTISGGCLEGEVAQQALAVIEAGRPRIETFDLADDDLILGFGVGCNGQVRVLIEPIHPAREASERRPDPLRLIERCHAERRRGLIATVIGAPGNACEALGRRLLLPGAADGSPAFGPGRLDHAVRADAEDVLAAGGTQIRRYDQEEGSFEVLFEGIEPPVRLAVFGDGHDVAPLTRTAAGLGWSVTVVGQKPPEVLAERFPAAAEHVFLMHPDDARETLSFDARTAAVIMNHQYERDRALLGVLLPSPVAYVGALGPRDRTEHLVADLREGGAVFSEETLGKLHGPVGLDIGTETPEEIALAIVAEVQATLSGRNAQKLRAREGRIHERISVA